MNTGMFIQALIDLHDTGVLYQKTEEEEHMNDESLLEMTERLSKSDGSTAKYYELPKDASELQHLISHKNMNAQIGEIFRACYRYGECAHSEKLRDAKKILFYAQAEIERLEKLNASKG